MTYSTVEAYIKDKEIIFSDDFAAPKKTIKVLVTFIETEENSDYNLYELPESEITNELIEKSKNVLKKDKKLFTNIY